MVRVQAGELFIRGVTIRKTVITSISVGLATGIYGISFGALGAAAGLSILDIMLLSLLMFSGGSQFAFIGVIAAGGAPAAAITSAWLLGIRNGFYALRMAPVLGISGIKKILAAQFTIDESNAVSASESQIKGQKIGFWVTGAAVYVFWNLATFAGAILGDLLGDPAAWGLDAAAAAAFLALVWPRLREMPWIALVAFVAAISLSPFLQPGIPVLIAALAVFVPSGAKR